MGTRPLIAGVIALCSTVYAAQSTPLTIDVDARSVQPGEVVLLSIGAPTAAHEVHVRAFNRQIQAFALGEGRWEALVGIDLDVKPGTTSISVEGGGARVARELVVKPKTFRTRRLTVDPDFVTPPPSAEARIEADAKLMARTWESSAPERLWSAPFSRPVADPANSAFGTRSIFNGLPRNAHGGADFLSPAGTMVHAPNAGRVLVARDLYYSGNTVVIDHGLGLFSMFAHLSAFDVREGDRIENRAPIGRVGATGRVTGPHLHWAVRANGARVDPLSLLAVLGKRDE
ncbi:MAG TPA: peptidoglycan DD-metalloendopeptidase family protein [Vicinamibacterales bacterium]|jgi:murein DD-endopeptidase MepM/ murein hydrolase activator NlpD